MIQDYILDNRLRQILGQMTDGAFSDYDKLEVVKELAKFSLTIYSDSTVLVAFRKLNEDTILPSEYTEHFKLINALLGTQISDIQKNAIRVVYYALSAKQDFGNQFFEGCIGMAAKSLALAMNYDCSLVTSVIDTLLDDKGIDNVVLEVQDSEDEDEDMFALDYLAMVNNRFTRKFGLLALNSGETLRAFVKRSIGDGSPSVSNLSRSLSDAAIEYMLSQGIDVYDVVNACSKTRFRLAAYFYHLCPDTVTDILLNDPHPFVRSAANISSQRRVETFSA